MQICVFHIWIKADSCGYHSILYVELTTARQTYGDNWNVIFTLISFVCQLNAKIRVTYQIKTVIKLSCDETS